MLNVTFTGTSSGLVSDKRYTSCIFISSDTASIVLDCGDGATGALLRAGVDPTNASAMVVTHMHPDHSGGLAFFIQSLHLKKRNRPFLLYVPESELFIKEMLIRSYIFPETIGFLLIIKQSEPLEKIDLGGIKIIPHQNRHMTIHSEALKSYPELKGRSYCIEIISEGTRIAYSSDVFAIEDLDWLKDSEFDLLICEATHIKPNELRANIQGDRIKRLILTHIDEKLDLSGFGVAFDGFKITV